jgi:hypothetical protein
MGRFVAFVLGPVAIASVALTAATPARAQAVRLGVVMDNPREVLEAAWSDDPHQVERAYCVTDWSYGVRHVSKTAPAQDDTIFRVFAVKPADVAAADPISVDFHCPTGMPELHVHTPTTCMGDDAATCVVGGLNAYSCQPSRGDLEKLLQRRDEFGVLQCDRHAFRFYYPTEYPPPPGATAVSSPPQVGNMTPAMKPAPVGTSSAGP